MRQITNLEDKVLYLIDYTAENCSILSLKYKYNFDFYPARTSNAIIWFSKMSSSPRIYKIDSDNHYSSPFDYMELFVDKSKFYSKRRVCIKSDLKFYDAHRDMRTKKNKTRSIKGTK